MYNVDVGRGVCQCSCPWTTKADRCCSGCIRRLRLISDMAYKKWDGIRCSVPNQFRSPSSPQQNRAYSNCSRQPEAISVAAEAKCYLLERAPTSTELETWCGRTGCDASGLAWTLGMQPRNASCSVATELPCSAALWEMMGVGWGGLGLRRGRFDFTLMVLNRTQRRAVLSAKVLL